MDKYRNDREPYEDKRNDMYAKNIEHQRHIFYVPFYSFYRAAAKARWIGSIEAPEADAAIKAAAEEYKIPALRSSSRCGVCGMPRL
jgi:hypothetical protein